MRFAFGTYNHTVFGFEHSPDTTKKFNLLFANDAHIRTCKCIASSESGRWLASGSVDELIRIYDTEKVMDYGTLHQHEGTILCLKFFKDQFLFSGGEDGIICIWDTKKWNCIAILPGHKGGTFDLSIHPSGKVALSVGRDARRRLWDLKHCVLAHTTKLNKVAQKILWIPNGKGYVIVKHQQLELCDITGKVIGDLPHPEKKFFHLFI